jgi:hypothetical protein
MDLAVKNLLQEAIVISVRTNPPAAIRTVVRALSKQTRSGRVSAAHLLVAQWKNASPALPPRSSKTWPN